MINITSEMLLPLGSRATTIAEILNAALKSVDPYTVTRDSIVRLNEDNPFSHYRHVGLVSMGKAAEWMARAALDELGNSIHTGIVVTKTRVNDEFQYPGNVQLIKGNHPVPGKDSLSAGKKVIEYLKDFDKQDAVLFLISGGASALVTRPVNGVELDDLVTITRLLLDCGADITEMNAVRKHIDNIKGGGLARFCDPAACISLVLSDVPGDALDVIASGPTVPDPTTFAEAMRVISKFRLQKQIPEPVLSYLQSGVDGVVMETLKPGSVIFSRSQTQVIASLAIAMQSAKLKAQELGYGVEIQMPLFRGEAHILGAKLVEFLKEKSKERKPGDPPQLWILGGETTVTISGHGQGGRNQELALGAVEGLSGLQGASMITFATDGEDGQSPAAGAIVTGETLSQAQSIRLEPVEFLKRNDSYGFFSKLGAVLVTGSTGTNVNDLVLLILDS
jgi:hydroxypyruvate reductase